MVLSTLPGRHEQVAQFLGPHCGILWKQKPGHPIALPDDLKCCARVGRHDRAAHSHGLHHHVVKGPALKRVQQDLRLFQKLKSISWVQIGEYSHFVCQPRLLDHLNSVLHHRVIVECEHKMEAMNLAAVYATELGKHAEDEVHLLHRVHAEVEAGQYLLIEVLRQGVLHVL